MDHQDDGEDRKKSESKSKDEAIFEEVWVDINGFTAKDWDAIRLIASELRNSEYFKGDPFKCTIGAFVLWVADGNGVPVEDMEEPAPDGTMFH